jgi:hypothetical protein
MFVHYITRSSQLDRSYRVIAEVPDVRIKEHDDESYPEDIAKSLSEEPARMFYARATGTYSNTVYTFTFDVTGYTPEKPPELQGRTNDYEQDGMSFWLL